MFFSSQRQVRHGLWFIPILLIPPRGNVPSVMSSASPLSPKHCVHFQSCCSSTITRIVSRKKLFFQREGCKEKGKKKNNSVSRSVKKMIAFRLLSPIYWDLKRKVGTWIIAMNTIQREKVSQYSFHSSFCLFDAYTLSFLFFCFQVPWIDHFSIFPRGSRPRQSNNKQILFPA